MLEQDSQKMKCRLTEDQGQDGNMTSTNSSNLLKKRQKLYRKQQPHQQNMDQLPVRCNPPCGVAQEDLLKPVIGSEVCVVGGGLEQKGRTWVRHIKEWSMEHVAHRLQHIPNLSRQALESHAGACDGQRCPTLRKMCVRRGVLSSLTVACTTFANDCTRNL